MVFIIAECGVNHNGDIHIAKQIIDMAHDAGADAIKFQTFKTDKLVSKNTIKAPYQIDNDIENINEDQGEMLKKYELSYGEFRELKHYCDMKGIEFISTPFDNGSAHFLDDLGVKTIKIGSGDLTNYPLLRCVARMDHHIILSTGMSNMSEVTDAVNFIFESGFGGKLTVLHCVSSYPTHFYDLNMACLKSLAMDKRIRIGFSDHTGIYNMIKGYDHIAAVLAVSCGAEIIEKHVTLDKNMQGPDHKASLTPNEFNQYVKVIRETERIMGSNIKKCRFNEMQNLHIARRSLAYNYDFKKGHILTEDDLIGLRPNTGICCSKYMNFVGMKLNNDVSKHTQIKLIDFV